MTFVLIRRPQSTAARRPQPAARARFSLVLLAALPWLWAAPAGAQTAAVRRDGEPFRADTSGVQRGRLAQGAVVTTGGQVGGVTQVTLEGWIIGTSVRSTDKDGHDLAVTQPENLRAAPNGKLVARLVANALLDSVEVRGGWYHVQREGWVATRGLTPAAGSAAGADSLFGDSSADARVVVLRDRVQLFRGPDAAPAGVLEAGSPVRITARAGDWLRVETAGWVKDSAVRQAGAQTASGVTAAELRNAPAAWQGKVLRWTIQFIALQTADEMRPDFTPGQRYILARGPGPEYAFVYVIVPPDKLDEVERLQPLDSVTVLARVVKGRSTFLANPILELLDIVP
jgi:Bacterial SH3 domain